MLLRGFSVMLFSGIFFCATANAAVFERDWKTPGDGLLTYDDVNQREWLDLTETYLPDFSGDDIESRYQSVVAEVAPGGMFEGFAIANKNTEIVALAESAGFDTSTNTPAATNLQPALDLISLLGEVTSLGVASGSLTVGFYEGFMAPPGGPLGRAAGMIFHFPNSGSDGSSGLRIGTAFSSDNVINVRSGVFMYRTVLPEPSTIATALVGAIMFNSLYRQRQHTSLAD